MNKQHGSNFRKAEIPLLILIIIFNIIISGSLYPLMYFAVAILHEFGHILAMCFLKSRKIEVKFVGVGIQIQSGQIYSYRQEIFVSIMGPLLNLLVAIIAVAFFDHTPLLCYFVLSNVFYSIVNLLPIRPLDGYKIIRNILLLFVSYSFAEKIMRVIASLVVIGISFAIFYNKYLNISLLILALVFIVNALIQAIYG